MGFVEFTAWGIPKEQPRQRWYVSFIPPKCRACGRGTKHKLVPYGNDEVRAWKRIVQLDARNAMIASGRSVPFTGSLLLVLQFVVPRPKAMTWARKVMYREPKNTKPDVDNFAVAAMNAMSGVVYGDDNAATDLVVSKRWAAGHEKPHLRVLAVEHPVLAEHWLRIMAWDNQAAPSMPLFKGKETTCAN